MGLACGEVGSSMSQTHSRARAWSKHEGIIGTSQ
jgi:hypothetical protein